MISKELSFAIKESEVEIRANKQLSDLFVNKTTDQLLKQNDIFKMLNLAKTLEIISNENINAFYNGSLTEIMVKEINDNGEKKF